MLHNFKKILTNLPISYLFLYLARCKEFFPRKYSTFSQHFHCKKYSLFQYFTTQYCKSTRLPGVLYSWPLGIVLQFFYVTCAMIGRKITNNSLEKKKVPCLDLFGGKTIFFPMVCFERDNFVFKVTPKKICQLNKLKH